jgi:hypothetical protein
MWVVLFFFLAVGGLVWVFFRDYRKKTQKWEAASKARFDRIFTEQAVRAAATAAPPVRPSAVPVIAPSTPVAVPPRITGRFLGQAETLVYYLLKTGIPDHAVFAKVPLESIIAAPGSGPASVAWQGTAQQRMDFLVCDRNMRIAAVIKLNIPGVPTVGAQPQSAIEKLRAAGVRVVEIDMANMPRREGIRKFILGDGVSGA